MDHGSQNATSLLTAQQGLVLLRQLSCETDAPRKASRYQNSAPWAIPLGRAGPDLGEGDSLRTAVSEAELQEFLSVPQSPGIPHLKQRKEKSLLGGEQLRHAMGGRTLDAGPAVVSHAGTERYNTFRKQRWSNGWADHVCA